MRRFHPGFLVLALGAVSVSPESLGQNEIPPPESATPDERKPAYSETQVASWEWQAKAAIHGRDLPEDAITKIVELSVTSRKRHAEGVAGLREEWIQQAEERLREIRDGGFSGPLFDRSDLDRSIVSFTQRERTKLANELIKFMDRPIAAEVYPPLGAYDGKVDGLAGLVVGMALDEERTLAAIAAIQKWHIATMLERARPRQDRALALANMNLERERLFETMRATLDADQFALFEKSMRRTKPADD